MGFGKFTLIMLITGLLTGLVLFGIVCIARPSLEAAADLGRSESGAWLYIGTVMLGGVLGWILTYISPAILESEGPSFWIGMIVFTAALLATSLVLERVCFSSTFKALLMPSIVGAGCISCGVGGRVWYES